MSTMVLDDLLEKSRLFPQSQKNFLLFSKNNFSDDLRKRAEGDSRIQLISLEDMYKL